MFKAIQPKNILVHWINSHDSQSIVDVAGINGKMSEFNTALGLLQLQYIDQTLVQCQEINAACRERHKDVKGIRYVQIAGKKLPAIFIPPF